MSNEQATMTSEATWELRGPDGELKSQGSSAETHEENHR